MKMKTIKTCIQVASASAFAAAVYQEVSKDKSDRTWKGTVAGFIPYDFRIPTPRRLRNSLWAPERSVLTPHAFGVGWSVNFGALPKVLARVKRSN